MPALVAPRNPSPACLRVLLAVFLAALAGLVFMPALQGQLLSWDDFEFIQSHSPLHHLSRDAVLDFFRFQLAWMPLPHLPPPHRPSVHPTFRSSRFPPHANVLVCLLFSDKYAILVNQVQWWLVHRLGFDCSH